MASSRTKPFRMAPLQRLKVNEIKDAAERAALDKLLKDAEKALTNRANRHGQKRKSKRAN
jgi:hypothetical protein